MQNYSKEVFSDIAIKIDIIWARFNSLDELLMKHSLKCALGFKYRVYFFIFYFSYRKKYLSKPCIPFPPLIYILYHRWNVVAASLFD